MGQDALRHDRRRLVLLAAAGHGYVALLVSILLGATAACAWGIADGHPLLIKIAVPLGLLVIAIGRSLAVRAEPPAGVPVDSSDAPRLLELVRQTSARIPGSRVDHVVVDDAVNAAVTQLPRLGPIFGATSYLVVGLPLLQAMSREEVQAVVAHELGHLSRSHGRFGAWVWRTRSRWAQLLQSMEQRESAAVVVLRPFFGWLVPRFDRAALAVSRAHEFEADAAAASIVGAEATADALVASVTAARAATDYWEKAWCRSRDEPKPDRTIPLGAGPTLVSSRRAAASDVWIDEALDAVSDEHDSHPTLRERLVALGQEPAAVVSRRVDPRRAAADDLLGDLHPRLQARFADEWLRLAQTPWEEEHARVRRERGLVESLEQRPVDALSPRDVKELARLSEEHRPERAVELWERVATLSPTDAEAVFTHGRLLAEAGDPEALDRLARAAELAPEAAVAAFVVGTALLGELGRSDEIGEWAHRLGLQPLPS